MFECKICNTHFDKNVKLTIHIKNSHNLTKKDYLLLTEYDNKHPTCECGCGEKVSFTNKKGFSRFIDKHSSKYLFNNKKIDLTNRKKKTIEEKLHNSKLSIDILKKYFDFYYNIEKPLSEITKELALDKRTFFSYCKELSFYNNNDEIRRNKNIHKFKWLNYKNKNKINDFLLEEIYILLKTNISLYTLDKIKKIFDLRISNEFLYNKLISKYDKIEIDHLLKRGVMSKPEQDYYFILSHFFGKKNIKKQFKLKRKFYDFLLGDNILIEFDGTYWHSTEEAIKNDKIKNKLAKDNNFVLIRIKDTESKNIDILKNIERIWNKQQTKK